MAFVFCLARIFFRVSPVILGRVTVQSMFAFLHPSHETDSSSGALFFAQRRTRNANGTRVIEEETQGTVGRRKMIGQGVGQGQRISPSLPPSCLVFPPIFIEKKTFMYEAAHKMCY